MNKSDFSLRFEVEAFEKATDAQMINNNLHLSNWVT